MNKHITIAIDGYSSCGKSTIAKDLAKKLNYIFVDSGAMYRGVTLYAMQNDLIKDGIVNTEELISELDKIKLRFELNQNKLPELILNTINVEEDIRNPAVSNLVSKIARIEEVRHKLVKEQREIGNGGGIVMDGRDIGTVVYPNAELKIFVTASISIRADRRYKELQSKGVQITKAEVEENLLMRDKMDSTREISPLRVAEDAITIDTSYLNQDQQLLEALKLASRILESSANQV